MTRKLAVILVAAAIGVAVGVLLRPAQHRLPGGARGDAALAERARALAPGRASALAVAVVTPEELRVATIGAPLDGEFELGSVTKAITGLLYADAIERGEVTPGTRLGSLLQLGETPAASITLEQLTHHRSGLPRLTQSPTQLARGLWSVVLARNPYREDAAGIERILRATDPSELSPTRSSSTAGGSAPPG